MYKSNGVSYVTSLPFVTKKIDETGCNWFDIQSTGNYKKDYQIGGEYALLFLKAMRDDNMEDKAELQRIIFSVMNQDAEIMRGIITGFFDTLNYWLKLSVRFTGTELDHHSYDEIIANIETIKSSDSTNENSHVRHVMQLLKIVDA